ncbi:hypothetical protein [Pseudomonas fluorescens]|uniref:hypothetical protein n=1 Tax=Pseudomonas fluorescens TaxID=294 RepID=UPI0014748500|nr:hypothetical protein [Pseudomonas fluorescens]NNB66981.1 hypothetical protein [Pseudomonas fluorescens]
MSMDNFKAGVQYNDSKGTAAADEHDRFTLFDYMLSKALIQADETIVGVKIFSGEVHGDTQDEPVSITAYTVSAAKFSEFNEALQSNSTVDVREVRFDIELAKFFGLFKRFEIAISRYHELNGRSLNIL